MGSLQVVWLLEESKSSWGRDLLIYQWMFRFTQNRSGCFSSYERSMMA